VVTKRLDDCAVFIAIHLSFTCNDAYFILIARCVRTKKIVKSSVIREQGMCHFNPPVPVLAGLQSLAELDKYQRRPLIH